ncbi:thiol reductant ABC exporter subunit CydD [Halomonas dongshanensis]|uniref:Thiol reductant ABC exporter subunit CydD n=1 Tax=Halomonas dongshanensis TaxID=2890835 RepID=A0ABT2EHZ1_9GAMM|nr:thiol reductant ABC exporter subunit CydD [Halomonas dongshanensis]MCS2610219.1 thiol reductant ABC exporter subunit CydD [Halomonas dongshanensis]
MEQRSLTARSWLKTLAEEERRRLHLAALLGVLAGAQTVVIVVSLAWWIDRTVVHHQTLTQTGFILALLATCILGRGACQWGQEVVALKASLRIRQRARRQVLDKLWALGPAWMAYRQSGAIATQVAENVEALDGYFARFLPQMRIVVLLPLLILAVVTYFDFLAGIFLLLSAPLIPLFMALVGMGAERMNREQFAAVARLSAHFIDRVRGVGTLQLFGRTQSARRDVWWATDNYRRLSMRTLRLAFLSSAVLEFFASVAIAVVAMYVGFGLLGYIDYGPASALTLFTGLGVLLLAPEFFQPLRTLSQHYHDRATALGAAESLVELLNEPTQEATTHESPIESNAVATLEAVEVEYLGRGVVLGPLDLTLNPGDVVALTGASGSGKSTLLALLAGFLAPSRGALRKHTLPMAWLDQQPCLLHGTLAENLRLADPEAQSEAMQHALEKAGLLPLLERLPDGLETLIGERGVGLSGGQAQRLALARVYLSGAQLVLLDEPTASLDRDTEQAVMAALIEWVGEGRTLVMATHHPAIVAMANRTLKIESGHVEEVSS